MQREPVTLYSTPLGKEMHLLVYGERGVPMLIFPTQDSLCTNMEDFGMIQTMQDWIDGGVFQVYVVDSNDQESWSNTQGDPARRAERQEQYYRFITEEVLPLIQKKNTSGKLPLVTGFSMGGTHAAIVFLRRPELFSGLLAISGVYNSDYFFGSWMNSTLYNNTPTEFIRHMPKDHPYIQLYNQKRLVFCVGQGAWEEDGIRTMKDLEGSMKHLGIHAWFDYWGYDVNHDWPWWKKMIRYHLPKFL